MSRKPNIVDIYRDKVEYPANKAEFERKLKILKESNWIVAKLYPNLTYETQDQILHHQRHSFYKLLNNIE